MQLAAGQTGAGKSYTVLGSSGELDADNQSELGLLPRIANALFDGVVAATAKHAEASRPAGTVESPSPAPVLEYNVEVSYLEIYNEAIKDLFNPKVVQRWACGVIHGCGTSHHLAWAPVAFTERQFEGAGAPKDRKLRGGSHMARSEELCRDGEVRMLLGASHTP